MSDTKNIILSVASSRKSKVWRPSQMTWADFCAKCEHPVRTPEPYAVYLSMNRDSQGDIKDVGGFMAGSLSCGQRKRKNVLSRSAITLDIDDTGGVSADDIWSRLTDAFPSIAMLTYSTHKHCSEAPRLRVVLLLERPVAAAHYEPVARMAAKIGGVLDICDPTTFDPSRMFYWPSVSKDGTFYYRAQDGVGLSSVNVLGMYKDVLWTDEASWPRVPGEERRNIQQRENRGKDLQDPLEKPGLVGAFCRAYSPIEKGIEALLSDVYTKGTYGRWSYIGASTTNGLVLYDMGDGINRWAYSNHSTDPAQGMELNIFDLYRIHHFGHLDEGSRTQGENQPSYKAMLEYAGHDPATKMQIYNDRAKAFEGVSVPDETPTEAEAAQAPQEAEDAEWVTLLDVDKKGKVKPTTDNFIKILENDAKLRNLVRKNLMSGLCEKSRKAPWESTPGVWTDDDDSNLRAYIERRHDIRSPERLADALAVVYTKHSYHPVRDYLNSLPVYEGDDFSELELVFTHYLGAEDNVLTRQMARKSLTAAVARVMSPGCKFDYCVTLIGAEGLGKSTFLKTMAGDWFTDSVGSFEGKDAMEQWQDTWIVEIGEMSAISRAGIDKVKQVLSSVDDKYRPAYGRRVETHPRQCVFFATTNEDTPLRGDTGNRRFWVVPVGAQPPTKSLDDLIESRDRLWSMALALYRRGEKLYLDRETEKAARERQRARNIDSEDPIPLMLEDFLEAELPADWKTWSLMRRRNFFTGNESQVLTQKRTCFSACEFICERLGKDLSDPNYKYLAQKVSTYMKEMQGWSYMNNNRSGHSANIYGRQRYWLRKES